MCIQQYQEEAWGSAAPYGHLLAGSGFIMLLCVDHAVTLYFGAQQSSSAATTAAPARRDSAGTASSSTSSSAIRHSGLSPRPAVRNSTTDNGHSGHNNGRSCNGKNCSNGSPSSQRLCTPHQQYCALSEEVCSNTAPLLVSIAAATFCFLS